MGKYSCYKDDCFAHHKAQCWLLNDTRQYQEQCPFYKTIKEYICEEKHRTGEYERFNRQTKGTCHA